MTRAKPTCQGRSSAGRVHNDTGDDGFRFYRRFGTLRNRVLLSRQQELFDLEKRLQEMDNGDQPSRLHTARYDGENPNLKRQLLTEIEEKLKIYGELPKELVTFYFDSAAILLGSDEFR